MCVCYSEDISYFVILSENLTSHNFALQGYLAEEFYFITFCVNFAAFLVQFVLSILSEKPSIYHYVDENNVRDSLVNAVLHFLNP